MGLSVEDIVIDPATAEGLECAICQNLFLRGVDGFWPSRLPSAHRPPMGDALLPPWVSETHGHPNLERFKKLRDRNHFFSCAIGTDAPRKLDWNRVRLEPMRLEPIP